MDHDKDERMEQVLNVPAYFLYGESWSGSVFGFFHIEDVLVRNVPNKWHIGLHRHLDFDQLSILLEGSCTFEHDGVSRSIEAPHCVYTPANVVHQFSHSPGTRGFIISFSSDFIVGLPSVEAAMNTVLLRLANERVVTFDNDRQVLTIRRLIELIFDKAVSRHPYRRDALRYLFGNLLLEFGVALVSAEEHEKPQPTTFELELFKRYREMIESTLNSVGFADGEKPPNLTVELFARNCPPRPMFLARLVNTSAVLQLVMCCKTPSWSRRHDCFSIR